MKGTEETQGNQCRQCRLNRLYAIQQGLLHTVFRCREFCQCRSYRRKWTMKSKLPNSKNLDVSRQKTRSSRAVLDLYERKNVKIWNELPSDADFTCINSFKRRLTSFNL